MVLDVLSCNAHSTLRGARIHLGYKVSVRSINQPWRAFTGFAWLSNYHRLLWIPNRIGLDLLLRPSVERISTISSEPYIGHRVDVERILGWHPIPAWRDQPDVVGAFFVNKEALRHIFLRCDWSCKVKTRCIVNVERAPTRPPQRSELMDDPWTISWRAWWLLVRVVITTIVWAIVGYPPRNAIQEARSVKFPDSTVVTGLLACL